jgi:hypothetical protein
MTQHMKMTLCITCFMFTTIACNLLQSSNVIPAPSITPTLTPPLEPTPTQFSPSTLTPLPTPTATYTPSAPQLIEKAGPFRLVTSLAELLPDPETDVQVKALADGSVWLVTSQEVLRWDGQIWETVLSESEDMLAAVDDDGQVWVLRQDMSKIDAWQNGEWTTYGNESGWTNASISEVGRWWAPVHWRSTNSVGDSIWFPMESDVRLFDEKRWTLYTLEDMGFPLMNSEEIGIVHTLATSEDSAEVWVGECYYSGPGPMGGKGVRWFDGKTWQGEAAPVGSTCVPVIEVDSSGNVWLGAPDVVWRDEPAGQTWTSFYLPEALLLDFNFTFPRQLVVDGAGDVWVMMQMCGGASCDNPAYLYRIHNGEWSLAIDSQDWSMPPKQLAVDGSGQGWLFWDGTVYLLDGDDLQPAASLEARSVDVSPDGRVWAVARYEENLALWVLEP